MHGTTEKFKYAQFNGLSLRDHLWILVAAILVVGGLIAVVPSGEAALNVNNVHCADKDDAGIERAVTSGSPLHDHHYENLRGNCGGISQSPSGDGLMHYSIAHVPGGSVLTYGDLHLEADLGETQRGSVCLSHNDPMWQPWECSSVQSWSNPWWEHWPKEEQLSLPPAVTPQGIAVQVAFSGDGSCDGAHETECEPREETTMIRYTGSSSVPASIIDPSNDTNPNQYLESENLTFWRIHDPLGDDQLEVGGIPLALTPGSKLELPDSGIWVRYNDHPGQGNEWIIESIEGDETVFVWNDTQGEWEIRSLEYEGEPLLDPDAS